MSYAKKQGDEAIPRAWSRYTQGSSAYALTHKNEAKTFKSSKKQTNEDTEVVEEKKRKFREFLTLMGIKQKDDKNDKLVGANSSWNDNFQEFMAQDA